MSNSKRLPRGGQPGTYTRHARGRHRRPSRTVALGSQTGATILAAGLAGAVLAIPATANAAPGSGGSAGAGNTNTGAAVPVPAITDAQVLASAGPPAIFYKAPPAPGAPASPGPVPLPMPRPADAPGPVPPASPAADAPPWGPFAPVQMYGLDPATMQRMLDAPAQAQPAPSAPFSVRGAGYLPNGLGGFVQLNIDPETGKNAMTLGLDVGVPGVNASVLYNDQSSTDFGADVQAQVGIPGASVIGTWDPLNTSTVRLQGTTPGTAGAVVAYTAPAASYWQQVSDGLANADGPAPYGPPPAPAGSGPTANGQSAGYYSTGVQFSMAPDANVNAFVRIPFSIDSFNQIAMSLAAGETGLPPEAYLPPTPQQVINDRFWFLPVQTGTIPAPSPAADAVPVPYLSIGSPAGPADPVTGLPAPYGGAQGSGSPPSWVVPGLAPAPAVQPTGSDGTGKQGLADRAPAPGTSVVATAPSADPAAAGGSAGGSAVMVAVADPTPTGTVTA